RKLAPQALDGARELLRKLGALDLRGVERVAEEPARGLPQRGESVEWIDHRAVQTDGLVDPLPYCRLLLPGGVERAKVRPAPARLLLNARDQLVDGDALVLKRGLDHLLGDGADALHGVADGARLLHGE